MAATLAVAALSARLMAESVAQAGDDVIALDVFGDLDTRRASSSWHAIGEQSRLRIDKSKLIDGLVQAAHRGAIGWVAGSGFESDTDALEAGAKVLPLIGTAPSDLKRLRDPAIFFERLAALDIPHPQTLHQAPKNWDARGWLHKDLHATGGWQVKPARADDAARVARGERSGVYLQRIAPGVAMSATFVADGGDAVVIGCNRLLTRRFGRRPYIYAGAIGPLRLPPAAMRVVDVALRRLVPAFALRGLGSLDFLLDGEAVAVLEVNARPPASMALYSNIEGRAPTLMQAHLDACRGRGLPVPGDVSAGQAKPLRGHAIAFARRRFTLAAAAAEHLAVLTDAHDLPLADTVFESGDPVLSVSAAGADLQSLSELLRARYSSLLTFLETKR